MRSNILFAVVSVFCAVGVIGCASTANNPDPYEKSNRFLYKVNDKLDKYALKPASDVYVKYVPKAVRIGLGNAFDNLDYFNVIANDLLQAKWKQGLADTGRMAANSTLGLAGVFDVSTQWGLPAHSNDFGLTLGQWGFKQGPYVFLPFFGPSSVRDAPGWAVKYASDPVFWVSAPLYVTIPLYSTDAIDARARAEVMVKFRNETALDPYVFTRDAYLQYRQGQLHGEQPRQPAPATTQKSFYDADD